MPCEVGHVADPKTPAEWLFLSRQHELTAKAMADDREAAAMTLLNTGLAVEMALKALIMHRERFNEWPSKASRPELHVHDLRALMKIAGITVTAADQRAAKWHVVLAWDRNQGYDPKPMPRKVAKSWVEAAFGEEGVVTWIRKTLA
jgi:hypothetical protein